MFRSMKESVRPSTHLQTRTRIRSASLGVCLFCAAIVFLTFSPPADAAGFLFEGRGNGHGVGMSQWGAWQAAREGYSFEEILAFYYPGTSLEQAADPCRVLRVRISSKPWGSGTTQFASVVLRPVVTSAVLAGYRSSGGSDSGIASADFSEEVPEGANIELRWVEGGVEVAVDGESVGVFASVEVTPKGPNDGTAQGRVSVQLTTSSESLEAREYWGAIRVQPGDDKGKLWVYNLVPLEKYVRGIAEVEYDWAQPGKANYAPEAVKAQAVAARTYAVAKSGTLADNWADQCYRGYSFEAKYPGIAQAAEDTTGLILTYGGQPITAFYSAHSGGYTCDSAWSGTMPAYIEARPDPWSLKAPTDRPGWAWTLTISAEDLSAKLNGKVKDTSGRLLDVGLVSQLTITTRDTADATSHVRTLTVVGQGGRATISAAALRNALGLPSTLILTINGEAGEGTDAGEGGGSSGDHGDDEDAGQQEGGGGLTGSLAPGEFYDVGVNHLYHDQIARVVLAGLMSGAEDGMFRPQGSVTRSQFAKIAVCLYNLLHPESAIALQDAQERPFSDVPLERGKLGDSSDWIAAAKRAGLVTGVTPTTFDPTSIVRRDQMATMLCRALGWEEQAAALSPDTPGFADVPYGSAHWAAATYLKQLGILQGFVLAASEAGEEAAEPTAWLRPADPIKRQHIAVILCRVLDFVTIAEAGRL